MSDKHERRAIAAKVMRDIRRRRAAQKERGRTTKTKEDLFEQIKVKMVMRIYGVSCEQAKEIIADRAAEKAALEAEDRAKPERRVRRPRRRFRDEDDGWIPASEVFSDAME